MTKNSLTDRRKQDGARKRRAKDVIVNYELLQSAVRRLTKKIRVRRRRWPYSDAGTIIRSFNALVIRLSEGLSAGKMLAGGDRPARDYRLRDD